MALIKCKECNKDVSNKAQACPHCGVAFPSMTDEELSQSKQNFDNDVKDMTSTSAIIFSMTSWFFVPLIYVVASITAVSFWQSKSMPMALSTIAFVFSALLATKRFRIWANERRMAEGQDKSSSFRFLMASIIFFVAGFGIWLMEIDKLI